MAKTESIERFGQFQAARAVIQIATDPTYDPFPEVFRATSGTGMAVELADRGFAKAGYFWTATERQKERADKTASATALTIYSHDITYESSGVSIGLLPGDDSLSEDLISHIVSALPAGDFMPVLLVGDTIRPPADDLSPAIDYALNHGLKDVADRLVQIGGQSLDDDEMPLQAAAAMNFVRYCIARKKQSRPLMTPTPTGELDAIWKSIGGHRVVMRFFPGGSVWVAYKLQKVKGSFQLNAFHDLLDLDTPIKIPDWA